MTATPRYKKVLVIDDDEMDIFISKRILHSAIFAEEIILKTAILPALHYIEELIFDSGNPPDLIFLDLNLPGKDGFSFLDQLNIMSAQSEIDFRVVILTNVRDSQKTEKAKNYPMVEAVLEKPLTPDALVHI